METCSQCSRFRQEILELDSDIEKALAVEVPEGLAARVLLNQSLSNTRTIPTWLRYGMAASFAAALVFGSIIITIGSSVPDQPQIAEASGSAKLDTDSSKDLMAAAGSDTPKAPMMNKGTAADLATLHSVQKNDMHKIDMHKAGMNKAGMVKVMDPNANPFLAHAAHQSHEFYGSEHKPISNEELEQLMSQFELTASIDHVVYAAICPFNGENAAHLVIKDGTEQYTVMLLPERSPGKMYTVDDDLWRGYVSPHPAGALAVLAGANDEAAVERVREMTDKLQAAIYLSAEL